MFFDDKVSFFRKISLLAGLGLFFGLFLTACGGDLATPTPQPATPTAPAPTDAPTTTVAAPPTATVPMLTPTSDNPDPVNTLPPAPTVPIATATPTVASPAPNGYYGPLPTPPRTLDPKAEAWAAGPKTFPKGQFVVGTPGGLYLLDRNGQNEKLIAGGAAYAGPKAAPDGSFVAAFRVDNITKQRQPILVDPTGLVKPLTLDGGGTILGFDWSPDSRTLALTRATDTNNDGVADEYDATTIVLYDVTSGKGQTIGDGRDPVWSPDGVRLAYVVPGTNTTALDPTTRQPTLGPNGLGVYNFTNKGKRDLAQSKGLQVTLGAAAIEPFKAEQKLDVRYFKSVGWHSDSVHITASADLSGPNGLRTGAIMTFTLENATPKVIAAGGDAAGQVVWAADGKGLAFETQPQYPVGPKSAFGIALLPEAKVDAPAPLKTILGDPATRRETRSPLWIEGGLAYLEGDRAILTVTDPSGQNPRHLISDCTGFDWF